MLKRSALVLMALTLLVAAVDTAAADNYKWAGNDGGKWSEAANWTPAKVPGETDTVTFDKDVAITVDKAASVAAIDFVHPDTATLTLNANLSTAKLTISSEDSYVEFKGTGVLSVTNDGLKLAGGRNGVAVLCDNPYGLPGTARDNYAILACAEIKSIQDLSIAKDKPATVKVANKASAMRFYPTMDELMRLNIEVLRPQNADYKLADVREAGLSYFYNMTISGDFTGWRWYNAGDDTPTDNTFFKNASNIERVNDDGTITAIHPTIKQKGNSIYFYAEIGTFQSDGTRISLVDSDTNAGNTGSDSDSGGGCAAGFLGLALLAVVPMFCKKR